MSKTISAFALAVFLSACSGMGIDRHEKVEFRGSGIVEASEVTSLATFPFFERYLDVARDFKAFTVAGCLVGGTWRSWCGWAWAYWQGSWGPQHAVSSALELCAEEIRGTRITGGCRLYAIGNVIVVNMPDERRRCVADLYRMKPAATNQDADRECPA